MLRGWEAAGVGVGGVPEAVLLPVALQIVPRALARLTSLQQASSFQHGKDRTDPQSVLNVESMEGLCIPESLRGPHPWITEGEGGLNEAEEKAGSSLFPSGLTSTWHRPLA